MYDEDEGAGGWGRVAARVLLVAVVGAVGWFGYRVISNGDDDSAGPGLVFDTATSATTTGAGGTRDDRPGAGATTTSDSPARRESVGATTTDVAPSTTSTGPADRVASLTPDPSAATTPDEPAPDASTPDATTPDATTAPPAAADTQPPVPYPTLPDGSPAPVVAIFDTETITLSGMVPTQDAADRLATLAIANSKTPAAVQSFLTIEPAVPINVGVRVIELNSARFPESSDEIRPEHAVELDRVATVMEALPHVTVLVIGHADQRGDDQRNFVISEARARAVVNYLVGKGIAADRLSSRAVGEADLLTLADDDAALALNRRTEFVFYGLLLPGPPS